MLSTATRQLSHGRGTQAASTTQTYTTPSWDLRFGEYTWETWTRPEYVERKKQSYWAVQDAFGDH